MMTAVDISAKDWSPLLARSTAVGNLNRLSTFHRDKIVMITGAGGSIGSALAHQIAQSDPRLLVLLDTSEQSLYQLEILITSDIGRNVPKVSILGNVMDQELLKDTFRQYRPDLVYHAAAHKHVPLMEANPFAAICNNAVATWRLAQTAAEYRVRHLLMISTDKAANPASIMGASKRIAELVLQVTSNAQTQMDSIRLGNVLGTQGSVVPRFLDQILHGGPVTVTHPDVERFFFTMEEAISLVFEAANCAQGRQVLVPEVDKPIRILNLAKYLIQKYGAMPADEMPIVFTGLRPGEKMHEEFVATDELLAENISKRLCRLQSISPSPDIFASAMAELDRTTRTRNLTAMLQVVRRIVRGYKPSDFLASMSASSAVDLHG